MPRPLGNLQAGLCSPGLRVIRARSAGFSLVEIVLALGIVSFSMLTLMAMLPIGMQVSRSAADLTVSTQIGQRLTALVQQTDSTNLPLLQSTYYYFDVDGQPLASTGTNTVPPNALYAAELVTAAAANPASLVDGTGAATLEIQIVNDPGHSLSGPPGPLPANLQSRAVIIPVYLSNNGM